MAAALPGTGARKPKLEFVPVAHQQLEQIKASATTSAPLAARLLRYGSIKDDIFAEHKDLMPIIESWLADGIIATRYRTTSAKKKIVGYRLPGNGHSADNLKPVELERLGQLKNDAIYSRSELLSEFGFSAYQVTKLVKNGLFEKVFDESGISEVSNYPIRTELPKFKLLEGQKKAYDSIAAALDKNEFKPLLLFGITGSGKTLVYCHVARKVIESGGSVLVLVPEIALSGLLLSSFAAFFGEQVTVIHSGLTLAQRLAVREKVASGRIKVVIGPRSALFSPMATPKLIIVDEEHDPSYKQDDPSPRYHGRDCAVMLARQLNIPIVLGSASPSIESYHNARTGRYELLTLDQRPKSGYKMPKIITLDMKREKISGECSFLSFRLKRETEKQVADGGQVIYYLNRRGFSPRLKCADCGEVPTCPDCGITCTYHRDGHILKCHFCDHVEPAPDQCPSCKSHNFVYIGAGTQRVEENLARLFANITAERIDSDRAATKSGRLVLGDFAEEKFDLLVGTQMVTKGLDIPGVSLVGVLAADIGLDMPDFRAAEKTYARLLQVAGRAGRGDREGTVMIQTYYTDHRVIRHLADSDFPNFYEQEIVDRENLFYPPFSRLVNITLSSEDEKLLEQEALKFRFRMEEKLGGLKGFKLLGPAPAPLYKLRGSYRRRIMIKCKAITRVTASFRRWLSEGKNLGLPSKVRIIFDIDPVGMM